MLWDNKIINLKKPFEHVLLFLRPDLDGWRFDAWHGIPQEPPETTLGLAFSTKESAAEFFTRVLIEPNNVVPTEPSCVPGRMPPAPECSYYWPPSLENCIKNYETDLNTKPSFQLPIRRALILGAGFSAAFQFATSKTIIKGVTKFFETSPVSWHRALHYRLATWLDSKFPDWNVTSPSLYEFYESFMGVPCEFYCMNYDPLALFDKNVSWESNNCDAWIKNPFKSADENTKQALYSFEALLAVYLLEGRFAYEVEVPWAKELFGNIEPSDAILTFNWDVIPEALMVTVDKPFCRYDWTSDRTKLMKLHGSIDLFGNPNIIMRGDCQALRERFECITPRLWRARTHENALIRTKPYPLGRVLPPSERYSKTSMLIIPPFFPMGYGYKLIQFNWRKARTALERAKEIYIIGYSLTAKDSSFQSLIKNISNKWNSCVTVDVWNTNASVGEKAEILFGRDRVTFHKKKASDFVFREIS